MDNKSAYIDFKCFCFLQFNLLICFKYVVVKTQEEFNNNKRGPF